ncbi:hypothetical protein SDC9_175782 [bioreactor metagenome]|uniref:Uncharacterized protein n=1 Tax=bioreactor metagenome TaxID=1076179 RepID=A0A645GN07_9ZZZZ
MRADQREAFTFAVVKAGVCRVDPGTGLHQSLRFAIVFHHKIGSVVDLVLFRVLDPSAQVLADEQKLLAGLEQLQRAGHARNASPDDDCLCLFHICAVFLS